MSNSPESPEAPQPTHLQALGLSAARGRLRLLTLNLLLLLIPIGAALAFAFYGRSDRVYLNNQIEVKEVLIQRNLQIKMQDSIDQKVIPDAHAYIDQRIQELLHASTENVPEDTPPGGTPSEGTPPTEPAPASAASVTVDPRVDAIVKELREGMYGARISQLNDRLTNEVLRKLEAIEKQLGSPPPAENGNVMTLEQRLQNLEGRLGSRPQGESQTFEARLAALGQKLRSIEDTDYGTTLENLERRLDRLDKPDSAFQKKLAGLEERVTADQLKSAKTDLEARIKDRGDTIQRDVDAHKSEINALKLRESRVLILKENSEEFEIDGLDFKIRLGKIVESGSSRSLEVAIRRGTESVFRKSIKLGDSASFKYQRCDYSLLVYRAAAVPLFRDYIEVVIDQRCPAGS